MRRELGEAFAADLTMANELHLASPDGQREIAERLAGLPDGTVELSGEWVDLRDDD